MKQELGKEVRSLVDFMSSCEIWEEEESLFSSVDNYFLSNFDESSHFVFSVPLERQKSIENVTDNDIPKGRLRTVWNKDLAKSVAQDQIIEMIREVRWCTPRGILLVKKSVLEKEFHIFHYGSTDEQDYFGVVSASDNLKKSEFILDHLVVFLGKCFERIQKIKTLKEASSLAFIDDVTGFYNHRKLSKDMDYLVKKYEKIKGGFSVLFMDIDHFKDVNDGWGHMVGTRLLHDFAVLLKNLVRETDYMYRYGGDEFVVVLTSTHNVEIKAIGERILEGVRNAPFKIRDGSKYSLSVSIGVADFPTDAKTGNEIIEMADKMMYSAKTTGRGRVCMANKI
ncbi:MAG: GGDEF domain-containing protein [Bacteriovoracaceae bacterium]|nr:GGDEF domain-containing protein [Bacteriovoracaceae bacterium]